MQTTELRDRESIVTIPIGSAQLAGNLISPPAATGLVLFAHGSGSSRYSPRNRYVAQVLQAAGLATLLFDLLTSEEEAIDRQTRHLRFDIALLVERLIGATDWVKQNPATQGLEIGYFGASTGSAAALLAAAARPDWVKAIVSRGGRPDLAGSRLGQIKAPTLLIVGGLDSLVLTLNQQAYQALQSAKQLVIIPGATHLFEEPGTLEQVALVASQWFCRYLA